MPFMIHYPPAPDQTRAIQGTGGADRGTVVPGSPTGTSRAHLPGFCQTDRQPEEPTNDGLFLTASLGSTYVCTYDLAPTSTNQGASDRKSDLPLQPLDTRELFNV